VFAVTIPAPGGPDVLTWSEVDDLRPGPDEVVIDIAAAGVNRAELLQRAGFYPPPPGASPYPGLECSGVVSALGAGVTQWAVGEQVCALLPGGGYAQQVAVHQSHVLPIPRGVSLVDAAALPEVACTVWSNVFHLGRLEPLDTLLIHGGASGIGTFAIQLATAHGSRVITTARAEKHAALLALGAEITVDYATEDFVAATRAATGGHGANVILDIMGASYLDRNVEALATGGRLVIIGLQGGRKAELDLGTLLGKRGTVFATAMRTRPTDEKAAIIAGVREHVWPLIDSGMVRPVIHTYVPMPEAARAHQILEESSHIGKVVLVAPPGRDAAEDQ
jgi:putative PIG3 family NAD(P)H quinone oxidoreductase